MCYKLPLPAKIVHVRTSSAHVLAFEHKVDVEFSEQKPIFNTERCSGGAVTLSFDNIFSHREISIAFRKHIQAEFSAENYDFVLEVRAYYKNTSPVSARRIFHRYIASGSPCEINISSDIREGLARIFATELSSVQEEQNKNNTITPGIFDSAAKEITRLMVSDSWPRFLVSEEAKVWIVQS